MDFRYLNYTVTIPFKCSNRESNFMKMLRQFNSFVLFLVSVIFLLAPLLREMVLKALARVGGGGTGEEITTTVFLSPLGWIIPTSFFRKLNFQIALLRECRKLDILGILVKIMTVSL